MLCKENPLLFLTSPEEPTQLTELHRHTDTQAARLQKLFFHPSIFFLPTQSSPGVLFLSNFPHLTPRDLKGC